MVLSFVCFFIGRAYIWYKNYQLRKKEKASERRASNTWAQDAAAVAVTPQPVVQQTGAAIQPSVTPPTYPAPTQSITGMAKFGFQKSYVTPLTELIIFQNSNHLILGNSPLLMKIGRKNALTTMPA